MEQNCVTVTQCIKAPAAFAKRRISFSDIASSVHEQCLGGRRSMSILQYITQYLLILVISYHYMYRPLIKLKSICAARPYSSVIYTVSQKNNTINSCP